MRPHTCPVCAGRGLVPQGFYLAVERFSSTHTAPETCRSCCGQGIVWSAAPGNSGYTYSIGYRVIGTADPQPETYPPFTGLIGEPQRDRRNISPLMREASNGCYCDACMEADERAEREGRPRD